MVCGHNFVASQTSIVAIANGYRNDKENQVAPLVTDFMEILDVAYRYEFKYHLISHVEKVNLLP